METEKRYHVLLLFMVWVEDFALFDLKHEFYAETHPYFGTINIFRF